MSEANLYWKVVDSINRHRIARRTYLAIKELKTSSIIEDLKYKHLVARNTYTPFSDASRILSVTYATIGNCQDIIDSRLYCNKMLIQMLEAKDLYRKVTGYEFKDIFYDYNINIRYRKYNS
jgi:hypothetical protein